jgi:hypothetical protein
MKITVIKQARPDDPEPRSCPWIIEVETGSVAAQKR